MWSQDLTDHVVNEENPISEPFYYFIRVMILGKHLGPFIDCLKGARLHAKYTAQTSLHIRIQYKGTAAALTFSTISIMKLTNFQAVVLGHQFCFPHVHFIIYTCDCLYTYFTESNQYFNNILFQTVGKTRITNEKAKNQSIYSSLLLLPSIITLLDA